jgi:Putative Flp pilus-assembly TadE/G-like
MNMKTLNPKRLMPRGQALVLFSFTLLLLVLMVTMTLSFGTKAKEKMEVQMVADTAAYSTAVATARVYNLQAVNNRVMIAHMVAMLGIHSAASFSSLTIGIALGLAAQYVFELLNQISRCNWRNAFCGCPGIVAVAFGRIIPLLAEYRAQLGFAGAFDYLVGNQANDTSKAVMLLYTFAVLSYGEHYIRDLAGQGIARRIAQQASGSYPGEWGVEGGGASVAQQESGNPLLPFFSGNINVSNLLLSNRHAVIMAMASRGHPFTAGRGGIGNFSLAGTTETLNQYLRRLVGRDVTLMVNSGNGYFANQAHSNNLLFARSNRAIADDHMNMIIRMRGVCRPLTMPVILSPVAVLWTRAVPAEGFHQAGTGFQLPNPGPFTFGRLPYIPMIMPYYDESHYQSGACLAGCPSAWTNFVDVNYNPAKYNEGNNWGQPKLPVTVRRDMRARPSGADPWNLLFRYRFKKAGPGTEFDTKTDNGIVLRDGTNISLQTGFATGITYFHRDQHLKEPPNLFSPFWRAGLTRGDVDDGSVRGGDIEEVLNNSNVPWAATTFRELWNAGFRGIP